MLVCWLCAVSISFLRYLITTCMRHLRQILSCPGPSSRKHPQYPPQAAFLIFSLQSVIAAMMEYYYRWRYHDPVTELDDQFVPQSWAPRRRPQPFGQRQSRGRRPFVRWPHDDDDMPDEFFDEPLMNPPNARPPFHWRDGPLRSEYATHLPYRTYSDSFDTAFKPPPCSERFSGAYQHRAKLFRYSFDNATNADNIWPRTAGEPACTLYPDSVEEVRVFSTETRSSETDRQRKS